jgi:hypothetical protein
VKYRNYLVSPDNRDWISRRELTARVIGHDEEYFGYFLMAATPDPNHSTNDPKLVQIAPDLIGCCVHRVDGWDEREDVRVEEERRLAKPGGRFVYAFLDRLHTGVQFS